MINLFEQQLRWRAVGIALLFLSSLSVVAQSPPPAQTPQTRKSDSITGRVVNESGQPLPNATVMVRTFGAPRPEQTATTDSEGKFELSGLEPLVYQITVGLSAYVQLPSDAGPTQNTYRVGDSVRIVMMKGGVITGTVTTQSGDPVVGVLVHARMIARDRQPIATEQPMYIRLTDDRGVYRIYGLPTGTYVVWAGGGNAFSGNPDPYDADVPTYSPSSTRDTAAEVSVQVGAETGNIDIRYRGERGRTVSGRVIKPQSGPVSVGVVLSAAGDGGSQWDISTSQAADGGGFSFYGVDDGDYDVMVRTFLAAGEWGLSEPKRIKVRGADVTGVELTIRPLASVTGRVILEELKTKECREKQPPVLTETSISAWHKQDEAAKRQPRFVWSLGAPVNADSQGNVVLRNLAPGDYYFVTRFAGKSWYLQSITLPASTTSGAKKTVDATRVWTNIKSGDRINGLTITLAEGAASMKGQLVLGEGETLSERWFAYLVPAEKEKADEVLRFYAVALSADGKMVLNNLAPGRYWMIAKPASEGAQAKLRLPDENELRARLRREAEAGKTEIELKPCQNVVDYQFKLLSRQ